MTCKASRKKDFEEQLSKLGEEKPIVKKDFLVVNVKFWCKVFF